MTATVIVTGANSYLSGHIIRVALEKGYYVRGTVRSASSVDKIKSNFPEHQDKLSFAIVSDITKVDNYQAAFQNPAAPITGFISVAAPFVLKTEDNRRDLLDPAIGSATAVLEAIRKYGPEVRRVVHTSSFAAVNNVPLGTRPGYTYTEKDWNPMSYDEAAAADAVLAYCASKSLAEKAMWDWVDAQKPSFGLAMINPAWVFGPHVGGISSTAHLNESSELLFKMLDAPDVPPFDFAGFADVRDVADAHLAALEKDEAAGKRFILAQHFDYQSATDAAREAIPELQSRLPVGTPGKVPESYVIDGSLAERVLGISYISLKQSMKDSFTELLAVKA